MATEAGERDPAVALWQALWTEVDELRAEVDVLRRRQGLEPRPARVFPRSPPAPLEPNTRSVPHRRREPAEPVKLDV